MICRITLVMQDYVQQGAINLKSAVVVNEAQLAEAVHEEINARSRGAKHLRQSPLIDFGNYRLGFSLLAELSEQ